MTTTPPPLLTRGALAALLLRDLGMAVEHDHRNFFLDLPVGHPYADELLTAVAYDLVVPRSETCVDPDGITYVSDAFTGLDRLVGSGKRALIIARDTLASKMHLRLTSTGYEAILSRVRCIRPEWSADEDGPIDDVAMDVQLQPIRRRNQARRAHTLPSDRWMLTVHGIAFRRPLRI